MNQINKNSILLGRDSGVSITSNYNKNVNKIILQKKELNIENTIKVDSKILQSKLMNLNKQNNSLNSFLTNSLFKISTTKQKQVLSELKTKRISNYNSYLIQLNKTESDKTLDTNKITLKNGRVISKLKAKYLNIIDMFAPNETTSITSSNKTNNINTQLIKSNNNNNKIIAHKKTNNSNINLIFNKYSDNKISKLLKSLFKFNKDLASFQYFVYNFNSNNNKFLKNITSILNFSFVSMSSLISRPVLKISSNKIVIHLFYYVKLLTANRKKMNRKLKYQMRSRLRFIMNSNKKNRFNNYNEYTNRFFLDKNIKQLKNLASNLSKILKKPVTLDLVRLHYIFNDSQILAKSIGLLSNRMIKSFYSITQNTFRKANIMNPFKMRILPNNQILPSFTTGIKVKFAGRLMRGRMIPKKTVKLAQEGALARSKANFVTTSRFTKKNKRGIFSVTVSIGHAFF